MDKNIIQLTSEKQFWFIKQRKNGSFVLKDIFGSTLNYSINDQSIIEKLKMSKGNLNLNSTTIRFKHHNW